MEVGRNEPCPCGSGKKYKKCCMKKSELTEIGQVKLEKFFRLKNRLIEKLIDEFIGSYSFQELKLLVNEFRKRVVVNLPEAFFHHWLLFYYRNQNGMRGIEQYVQKRGDRNEPELQSLAEQWKNLVPRLIQQVDYDDQGVIVEDLLTKEQFHMPYCETMPEWIPWAGTFTLLEEFDDGIYMNGVASIVGPDQLKRALNFLENQMKETGCSFGEAAITYYPEILNALLVKPVTEQEMRDVVQTTFYYNVKNMALLARQFTTLGHFQMDNWDGVSGKGKYIKNVYHYIDNASPGPIRLVEEGGSVKINHSELIYTSNNLEEATSFKEIMSNIPGVTLVKEKTDKVTVPAGFQAYEFDVLLAEGVPEHFSFFAQQAKILLETDQALPLFNGLSPQELADHGRMADLEQWVRQQEYDSFMLMEKIKVTADFNTIRRKLGLKQSPFVTLGDKRQSTFILEEGDVQQTQEMDQTHDAARTNEGKDPQKTRELTQPAATNENNLLIEEIGISQTEADKFFVKDILEFFYEKAKGKAKTTYSKYRLGLQTISYFLSLIDPSDWSEVKEKDWERLLVFNYLVVHKDATVNQAKGFFAVLKSFAAMVDETHGTAHRQVVRKLVKELEPSIFAAIQTLNAHASHHQRRQRPEFMQSEVERILQSPVVIETVIEGVFQVESIAESEIDVKVLNTGRSCHIQIEQKPAHLQQGMLLIGSIIQEKEWEFFSILRILPAQAANYLTL